MQSAPFLLAPSPTSSSLANFGTSLLAHADEGGVSFDSYMIPDNEIADGQPRLLDVDARVVLPIETHTRFILSSTDVIHDWAVPALGIKMDAMPGRLNQTSTLIERKGQSCTRSDRVG